MGDVILGGLLLVGVMFIGAISLSVWFRVMQIFWQDVGGRDD